MNTIASGANTGALDGNTAEVAANSGELRENTRLVGEEIAALATNTGSLEANTTASELNTSVLVGNTGQVVANTGALFENTIVSGENADALVDNTRAVEGTVVSLQEGGDGSGVRVFRAWRSSDLERFVHTFQNFDQDPDNDDKATKLTAEHEEWLDNLYAVAKDCGTIPEYNRVRIELFTYSGPGGGGADSEACEISNQGAQSVIEHFRAQLEGEPEMCEDARDRFAAIIGTDAKTMCGGAEWSSRSCESTLPIEIAFRSWGSFNEMLDNELSDYGKRLSNRVQSSRDATRDVDLVVRHFGNCRRHEAGVAAVYPQPAVEQ